jgi:hypothetical protein
MNPGRVLRVLIGIEQPSPEAWGLLGQIENLRDHLQCGLEDVCEIQLLAPNKSSKLVSQAELCNIHLSHAESALANELIAPEVDDLSLRDVIATAQKHDCDYIVVPDELLPYIAVVGQRFHIQLGDFSFLHRLIEIFVCGFGVTWSFENPVFYGSFNHLYFEELQETVPESLLLMDSLARKEHVSSGAETLRSLLYNRLPQLCYCRDQLLFYLLQREAQVRGGAAKDQPFAFELAYHLNFCYILIYGALDHAAVLVNEVCQLGFVKEQVGATKRSFRKELHDRFPVLHGIFSGSEITRILSLIGGLRHLTAHRGYITPTKLIKKPDREPTDEELDAYLSETCPQTQPLDFADKPEIQKRILEMERSFARMELLERNSWANDILAIENEKRLGYFRPFEDVTWPVRASLRVLRQIIQECLKITA